MAKTVTIKLIEPIIGHQGPITELKYRLPGALDHGKHGDAVEVHPDGRGGYVEIIDRAAMETYKTLLLVEPEDKNLLQQVSLADSMQIEREIKGFFYAAWEALSSLKSSTSSS